MNPGDTAVWDPATDTWTRVESTPVPLSPIAPGIWTGREVLVWGQINGPSGSPSTNGGLRFGP
jgi:hypothetical protein